MVDYNLFRKNTRMFMCGTALIIPSRSSGVSSWSRDWKRPRSFAISDLLSLPKSRRHGTAFWATSVQWSHW